MASRSFLLATLAFILTNGASASAQEQIQFGPPVQADVEQVLENSLPLSALQPPRELAANSEVIVISGYQSANQNTAGTTVKVEVNRPGSTVLLILASYEKITWQVSATPSTTISGIITSGYKTPTVTTLVPTQGYLAELPYVYETGNASFVSLLAKLNSWFGIDRVDAFRGGYSIPSAVTISSLDSPDDGLTLNGPSPQEPNRNFTFDLFTTDLKKAAWSLTGPVQDWENSYLEEGKIAMSMSGEEIYRLNGDELEILNQLEGSNETMTLPPNFPQFSWAMDLAYDTRRNIISVVTLGGEGYLYRFDAMRKQWIDLRSLSNIDIFSLSYDQLKDRYVAWISGGRLLFFSGDGNALFVRNVLPRLTGFGRLYDRGNERPPRLTIVPNEDDIALIYISENCVKNIWLYDVEDDTAMLTYRNQISQ